MNKYKSLISNTLVFAVATFSSKLLSFVMMRFYTAQLQFDYAPANVVVDICNLILPVMYLCVNEGVIRYGLDKSVPKSDVFSTGVMTVFAGYAVLWCFYPLIRGNEKIGEYTWLIYIFVLTSALRSVVTHFVRASGFVRLFAIDGVVAVVTTISFNVLFLAKLKMGVAGYVLGTICADAISALGLFLLLKLYRFVKIKKLDMQVVREMLSYCIPLVPTAVFWWVTNLSDRFFLIYMIDNKVTSHYTAAARVAGVLTIVSAVFTQAWQISAYTEYETREGERFFSMVFKSYYTLVFLASSGIVLLAKPLTALLTVSSAESSYAETWKYIPMLALAVAFSCFVTFLGSIYNAAKKNLMVSVTTVIGGVLNIILNWRLIPSYGAQGAAFATFVSYLVVFVIRAVDTRKYLKLRMQPFLMALNLILLLFQAGIALSAPAYWAVWECGIFLALLACNHKHLLYLIKQLYGMIFSKREAN